MKKKLKNDFKTSTFDPSLIDLSYLNELSDGNIAFEKDMILLFLNQLPIELENLMNAIVLGNQKQIKDIAHKLRSSLDIFGKQDLSDRLKRISEEAALDPESEEILEHIKFIEEELDKLYPLLERQLETLNKS